MKETVMATHFGCQPHQSIYPVIHLTVYPVIHLSIYPVNHQSVYPATHLSIYPATHLSIWSLLRLSYKSSINLSCPSSIIYPVFYQSICPVIYSAAAVASGDVTGRKIKRQSVSYPFRPPTPGVACLRPSNIPSARDKSRGLRDRGDVGVW